MNQFGHKPHVNDVSRTLALAFVVLTCVLTASGKDKNIISDNPQACLVKGPGGMYGLWEYECGPRGSRNPPPEQRWRETQVYFGPLQFSVPCSFPMTASLAATSCALALSAAMWFWRHRTARDRSAL